MTTLEQQEQDAFIELRKELMLKAEKLASEIREDIANGEARWLIVHKRHKLNRINSLLRG